MTLKGSPGTAVSAEKQASLLELAAHSVADGIVAIDEQSVMVFANAALAKMFGYSVEELTGKKLTLLMPHSLRGAHRSSLERYVSTGRRRLDWSGVKLPGLHRSGREIPVEISFGEIVQDGRPLFVGVVRDITARLQAEDALRISEQRYRSLADASAQMVWTTTAHGELVEDSPGWRSYTGQTWEECRGLGWMDAVHPDDRASVTEAWRESLRNRAVCEVECRLRRKDGEYGHFRVRGVPVLEKDGRVREWVGMCTDITERLRSKKALEASERRYRELVALAPIGIYRSTQEGRFDSVNLALVRLLGYESAEEVFRLDMARDVYFDNRDRQRLIEDIERLGGVAAFEVCWKRHDGSPLWVRLDARVVRGASGGIEYETFVHDIHQRKRAEEALRRSEERFHRSFSVSPVAMSLSEPRSGRIVDINERFAGLLEYGREELIGKTSMEMGLWVDPADRIRMIAEVAVSHGVRDREIRLRTKQGEVRHIVGSIEPIEFGDELLFLSVFQDITERKRAEDRLRVSEERYRLLFEKNPFPMWVFDNETLAFLAVNESACRHYGYSREEFLSMTIEDIGPPEDVPALRRQLGDGNRDRPGVWRHHTQDGTVIDVEITSNPFVFDGRAAWLVLAADVTERYLLEDQLHQAQKMEAIGQLAGGIAHDFNNLLTVILGYGDVVRAQLPADHPSRPDFDQILAAGERAAALTRQLLAFSRRQVLLPQVLDVNAVVSDLDKMLRRLIGEDIDLLTCCDPRAGRVKADPGQLAQVLLNLAVNARDAMPGGGRLTIETRNAEWDEAYARDHKTARPGSYVMVSVSDTGMGMDKETKAHVFEPFFTTKEKGKGTGLGLATVYGIVKQSGGFIWVYSEPGKGTTFKVYFPRVDEEGAVVSAGLPRPVSEMTSSRETLLLVEDEDGVRRLSREVLQERGYTVLEASNAKAALEIATGHPGRIDLVLTDVVMPEMGGRELASRLTSLRAGLKVLFMSGYASDAAIHHGLLEASVALLQKPFTRDELARSVRELLDAS